jgi:hypothetical protein
MWFIPKEYYDRNQAFFHHFVHNLSPIYLYGFRNTTCLYSKDVAYGYMANPESTFGVHMSECIEILAP